MNPAGPSVDRADVTLAVLAGGEGSRMGRAKATIEVGGRPILEYLLDRFRWPGPTLLVTAPGREHPPGAERFDREVLDEIAGQGPLRGALTALDASRTEVLFITTVDMPGIGTQHAEWLLEQLGGDDGVMCRHGGQIEPFPLVLRRGTRDLVRGMVNGGERSVRALADSVCSVLAAPWSEEAWVNLNRPEDLSAWRDWDEQRA